jgi:hypothetical protein
VVPIANSFRPSRDPARALPLSHSSSDSDGGILQIDPYSHFGRSHPGPTFGIACRGFLSDPDKPFRPISSLDETIVLSYIAADSDGGILWGAFSAQVLRFGYLGKWSPCAYESLSTKGEDFYPHTLLYDSNFTLT